MKSIDFTGILDITIAVPENTNPFWRDVYTKSRQPPFVEEEDDDNPEEEEHHAEDSDHHNGEDDHQIREPGSSDTDGYSGEFSRVS